MQAIWTSMKDKARRVALALTMAGTMALAGCASGDLVPRGHGKAPPRAQVQPRAPIQQSPDLRQCYATLKQEVVQFSALPDRSFGGGCNALGSVKLLDFGVPATNLGAMTCPLAANFAAWGRYGVQPAARLLLGSEIARIETFGTYACRPIAGSSTLSEHAHSNAVDVAAFVLADGRRISVKDGWTGDRHTRQFLAVVHASACKRFRTVLGPDYNAAHRDHLHFDMGGRGGFCR